MLSGVATYLSLFSSTTVSWFFFFFFGGIGQGGYRSTNKQMKRFSHSKNGVQVFGVGGVEWAGLEIGDCIVVWEVEYICGYGLRMREQ